MIADESLLAALMRTIGDPSDEVVLYVFKYSIYICRYSRKVFTWYLQSLETEMIKISKCSYCD